MCDSISDIGMRNDGGVTGFKVNVLSHLIDGAWHDSSSRRRTSIIWLCLLRLVRSASVPLPMAPAGIRFVLDHYHASAMCFMSSDRESCLDHGVLRYPRHGMDWSSRLLTATSPTALVVDAWIGSLVLALRSRSPCSRYVLLSDQSLLYSGSIRSF